MISKACRYPANDRVREVAKAKAAVAVKERDEEKDHPKMLAEPALAHRQTVVDPSRTSLRKSVRSKGCSLRPFFLSCVVDRRTIANDESVRSAALRRKARALDSASRRDYEQPPSVT